MSTKQKNKHSKTKPNAWFIPVRGSYLPNSFAGWITYIPYIAYIIATYIIAINETESLGLAILYIVPNQVTATVVLTYVASKKS